MAEMPSKSKVLGFGALAWMMLGMESKACVQGCCELICYVEKLFLCGKISFMWNN